MKKDFIDGIKITVLGMIFGLCVGMVSAFTPPSGPPQSYNELPPISYGTDPQTKAGDLWVDAFAVAGGAGFNTTVSVEGNLTVNGNKKIANYLTITSLAGNTNKPVCLDGNGKFIICP